MKRTSPSCDGNAISSRSFLYTSIGQCPGFVSSVENTRASSSESIHSSILGRGKTSLTVTTFRFQKLTEKRSAPSFLGSYTTSDVHSVWKTLVTCIFSILSISSRLNLRTKHLRWYSAECIGRTSSDIGSIRSFTASIWPKCYSHMSLNPDSKSNNSSLYSS